MPFRPMDRPAGRQKGTCAGAGAAITQREAAATTTGVTTHTNLEDAHSEIACDNESNSLQLKLVQLKDKLVVSVFKLLRPRCLVLCACGYEHACQCVCACVRVCVWKHWGLQMPSDVAGRRVLPTCSFISCMTVDTASSSNASSIGASFSLIHAWATVCVCV